MKMQIKIFTTLLFTFIHIISGCKSEVKEGNVIETLKIGKQEWMTKNLNVEQYRNGDSIPQVQNAEEWGKLRTGAWCYYENDSENGKLLGKLYNWYAVNDPRGLAPKGWHIPSREEYDPLKSEIINNSSAAKVFIQGIEGKISASQLDINSLLGGLRTDKGLFKDSGLNTFFWSSTEVTDSLAFCMSITDNSAYINLTLESKHSGFSIRCLKD